jgi:hypothetical protein
MSDRTAILESIIEPDEGSFSPEHARYVLSLSFPSKAQKRYLKLSEKAQQGFLSKAEEQLLDEYLNTNAFLTILKSKARVSLKKHGSAA